MDNITRSKNLESGIQNILNDKGRKALYEHQRTTLLIIFEFCGIHNLFLRFNVTLLVSFIPTRLAIVDTHDGARKRLLARIPTYALFYLGGLTRHYRLLTEYVQLILLCNTLQLIHKCGITMDVKSIGEPFNELNTIIINPSNEKPFRFLHIQAPKLQLSFIISKHVF